MLSSCLVVCAGLLMMQAMKAELLASVARVLVPGIPSHCTLTCDGILGAKTLASSGKQLCLQILHHRFMGTQ